MTRIQRRLRWYRHRLEMDNPLVGRLVELTGNQVRIDGLTFSVDNPLIQTRHKSTMYFGLYEIPERKFIGKYITPDSSVVELGGSIGVVSCLINRRLSHPERHVVVEASPAIVPTLERNKALNGALFTVIHAAVSYGAPTVQFASGNHFLMGSIGADAAATVSVPAVGLGQVLDRVGPGPVVLVSDIEGAETSYVQEELAVLARRVRLIIMETHPGVVGVEANAAMLGKLSEAGFDKVDEDCDVVVLVNRRLAS